VSHRSTNSRQPAQVIRHLERLLEIEDQRLDARRAELGEVREAIRALSIVQARSAVRHEADLEVIPAEVASDVIAGLLDELGPGIVRSVTRTVEYGPGLEEERIRDTQQRMADGLVLRCIYPLSVLDTAVGRRWIGAWSDAGEEQRFVVDPPSEFLIAGSNAVLACAEWNVPESDYVIIREPMLIAAFTALHENTYASGVALGADLGEKQREAKLIDLMALGLKDEAIARTLGLSLRTVRRRIADLMDEHGVDTRFQLGAALLARGRLETGPSPLSGLRASMAQSAKR